MKSADVSGKAISPQVCHTQADIAPAAGQVAAGGLAARAGAALATPMKRVSIGNLDRLAREMAQRALPASMLRPERVRVFVVEVPARHAAAVAGYAPARPAAASSQAAAGSSGASRSSASTSSSGEWAFLDSSRLSIEDKLFMFMKLVMKKSNDELEKKMKEYKASKANASGTSGSSGTAKKSSGGLFGVLKSVFPPLAALAKVVPALPDLVNKLATQLGPQLLGALMIPLGAPWAAPLVQQAASQLLPGALDAVAGSSSAAASSSSSSGTSGSAASGEDERMQLLEIERMVQKTNQMFATVSNILKATHDAAMTAVNNIR